MDNGGALAAPGQAGGAPPGGCLPSELPPANPTLPAYGCRLMFFEHAKEMAEKEWRANNRDAVVRGSGVGGVRMWVRVAMSPGGMLGVLACEYT